MSAAVARAAAASRVVETPMQQLAGLVRDPVRFSRGLLRHDPWSTQEAILRSVAVHPRTAVKACHASGKTHVAADAVIWWTVRYADGIVVTTAPTWTQVERLLWGEIHKTAGRARIQLPPLNKTELPIGPDNYAIGLSTNEGVRFQGWHGRILLVLDEAPGVLPEIYEAIEGIRAGGHVHVLLLGNPIVASGPFHDAHVAHRASWNAFTISAFDTPNFRGVTLERLLAMSARELDTAERPYLVTRRWVREKYEEWGTEHPLWESKVLGQFPTQAEDALIALGWLERSREPVPGDFSAEPLDAGLDVAGPGDALTVLKIRQGPNVISERSWSHPDPRGAVVAELRPFAARLRAVNVDEIGMGYYFAQHLKSEGFPVVFVNVGDAAQDAEHFANRKAELYWALRLRAEPDGTQPGKPRAIGGLSETAVAQLASIRYRHTARGQVQIESKDEMRKRGVKSPDDAEATMLAFVPPAAKSKPAVTDPRRWHHAGLRA